MNATSHRTEPSAVVGASPDQTADATPTRKRVEKRFFNLPVREKLKQFSSRLQSNAKWMKQFLHGGK